MSHAHEIVITSSVIRQITAALERHGVKRGATEIRAAFRAATFRHEVPALWLEGYRRLLRASGNLVALVTQSGHARVWCDCGSALAEGITVELDGARRRQPVVPLQLRRRAA